MSTATATQLSESFSGLQNAVPSSYPHGMTEMLQFMMGEYRARFPNDRFYCGRHMWLQPVTESTGETSSGSAAGHSLRQPSPRQGSPVYRVGFTDYSVRLLQDVYFLEWSIDEQTAVADKQEIGEVESSKAVSSMYSPCAGQVMTFNEAILNDPALINTDNYDTGFLYTFQTDQALLSAADYVTVLEKSWEDAQRVIKGQMN